MGFNWTKEQRQVIDTREHSILVSAAAGSGKTAVLVERIIALLTDETEPADIDSLLIVTFTSAAAAEMRERIGRGIEQKLLEQPGNKRLSRQRKLLSYAQISTIHSLCMRLIRDHFNILDLDPSFKMADEAELKLLRNDVATDVMEVYYAAGNRQFRDFVERYARGKTDAGIVEMIIQIYTYAQGYPWPDYWLEQCCEQYTAEPADFEEHPVIRYAVSQMHEKVRKNLELLRHAGKLCMAADGPAAWLTIIQSDMSWLEQLDLAATFEQIREVLSRIQWKRLTKTAAAVSEHLKDEVKAIRADVKADIGDMEKRFFRQSVETVAVEMNYIRPSVEMLTELVRTFSVKYAEAKADRNMLDFSDLEHYALKLLVNFGRDEEGRMTVTPTLVADALSRQYTEIICDEYQDSNLVQEMILSVLSGERFDNYNRFMVGDVKQSIYRFRLADASIFMEKYDTYGKLSEVPRIRIDLHQNFRSRAYVLESINFFFWQIMTKELGGICYDDDAALYPGMIYPEAEGKCIADQTELLLVDYNEALLENEDAGLTAAELEARAVAAKIHELTDSVTGVDIYDSKTGDYRRAGYSDIVVLLRTMAGWADTFVNVFGMENIPASAELSEGFFETGEIQTMTAMLSVIDNPGQDIPLAAVLKSPIAGLSSEELALIRACQPEGSLYTACLHYEAGEPGFDKLHCFLEMLDRLRTAAGYLEIHELLQCIYDETGYYDYVQAMPAGQRRCANLDLLVERAVSYGKTSLSGLFNFVRYIEQLKKNEIDFGEASVPVDGKGRIRILSIHKSKGLEYPIVILAGMGKQMNFQDARQSILIHPVYGIGMDAVNLANRKKMSAVYKRFIADQMVRDVLAEELRILYVAMTRAKEKLVMIGCAGNLDERLREWSRVSGTPDTALPIHLLTDARTWLDWIMPCLMRTGAAASIMEARKLPFSHGDDKWSKMFLVSAVSTEQLVIREVRHTMAKDYRKEALLGETAVELSKTAAGIQDALTEDENWHYNWEETLAVRSKYTVSELKRADGNQEDGTALFAVPVSAAGSGADDEELPSFMKEDEDTVKRTGGAFRGTAYHRVLELMDFAACIRMNGVDDIRKQMRAMTANCRLSGEQFDRVNAYDIYQLVTSDLGRRMVRAALAGLLRREAQFVMGVPASMVDAAVHSEELVVVQGVIDAYFEENGKLILVDYKTDFVPKEGGEAILVERYGTQLDYYQYALEKITGKSVSERMIYSFTLKKTILA